MSDLKQTEWPPEELYASGAASACGVKCDKARLPGSPYDRKRLSPLLGLWPPTAATKIRRLKPAHEWLAVRGAICNDRGLDGHPGCHAGYRSPGNVSSHGYHKFLCKSSRFPALGENCAVLFVVLLVIALAVPYFLDVDRYRDTIAERHRETDRPESHARADCARDSCRASALTVDGLHIGNPQGFPEGDVVSADEIRVNVALGPLLHRTIHVNSVDLVRPKLSLVTDSSGKDNYTFTSRRLRCGPPQNPASPSSSVSLDQIESINLTDAEVLVGSRRRAGAVLLGRYQGHQHHAAQFRREPDARARLAGRIELSGVTLTLEGWSAPVAFQSGQVTLFGRKNGRAICRRSGESVRHQRTAEHARRRTSRK